LLALALGACAQSPVSAPTSSPTAALPTEAPTVMPNMTPAPPTVAVSLAPTAVSAAPPCVASDLKASHDLVEGAAGSRLTTVVLSAATTCSVDLHPAMDIRDGDGTELVGSTTTGSGRIDLDADVSYSSEVRFANWCNPDPKFPLALVIRLGVEEVGVTGSSFPEAGDMPPCSGGGGPLLDAGTWTAAP
jgi:hypothetical protein